MNLPPHLRQHLECSDRPTLQIIASFLLQRALDNGKAATNLTDAFREVLDLLRAGRISEATEIAERVCTVLDVARCNDDHLDDPGAPIEADALALMKPKGRA